MRRLRALITGTSRIYRIYDFYPKQTQSVTVLYGMRIAMKGSKIMNGSLDD